MDVEKVEKLDSAIANDDFGPSEQQFCFFVASAIWANGLNGLESFRSLFNFFFCLLLFFLFFYGLGPRCEAVYNEKARRENFSSRYLALVLKDFRKWCENLEIFIIAEWCYLAQNKLMTVALQSYLNNLIKAEPNL